MPDDTKLEIVIHKWLKPSRRRSFPTWDKLIEVLEILGWRGVARNVTQFLTTDPEAVKKYNWEPGMYNTRVPQFGKFHVNKFHVIISFRVKLILCGPTDYENKLARKFNRHTFFHSHVHRGCGIETRRRARSLVCRTVLLTCLRGYQENTE